MVELKGFDGHIVLYCKNHYSTKSVTLIDGLRRIWAIRCGLDIKHANSEVDQYIANRMYSILKEINPDNIDSLIFNIHSELSPIYSYRYEDMSPLEILIQNYRSVIAFTKVKDDDKILIKLPKPNKNLFKRIIEGKGKPDDYYLVEEKNNGK